MRASFEVEFKKDKNFQLIINHRLASDSNLFELDAVYFQKIDVTYNYFHKNVT